MVVFRLDHVIGQPHFEKIDLHTARVFLAKGGDVIEIVVQALEELVAIAAAAQERGKMKGRVFLKQLVERGQLAQAGSGKDESAQHPLLVALAVPGEI